MANTIQEFVEERGIKALFHFTRLSNLESILDNGLLPRDVCQKRGIAHECNDALRLDYTDAVSSTISFPNYKLFYRFRMTPPVVDWAVIALNPKLLWETDVAFCATNAAAASAANVPLAQQRGLAAMKLMFDDFEGKARAGLGIPDNYTTNPQAEVLLLDGAAQKYIKGVFFETAANKMIFENMYEGGAFKVSNGYGSYFAPRQDHKSW